MIKILIKFSVAFGIIYWLVNSGKIDTSMITKSFEYKYNWMICISLMITNGILTSFRWRILLKTKSEKELPIKHIVKLTWIGLFFSSILPGAVTGDVLKLVYARDLDSNLSKTFLITSAVMDRITGLIGLLFLMGIFNIIYYAQLTSKSPEMARLVNLNFFLFLGVIIFFITLFLPRKIQDKIHLLLEKIPVIGTQACKTFEQVWTIGKNKPAVFKSIGISLITQTFNVLALWTISRPFFETDLPFSVALSFIPIGFVVVAIPISPAGAGIGNVIFEKLFSMYGMSNGATLFALYLIAILCVNLSGAIPVIFTSRKRSLKDAQQEFGENSI